MRSYAQQNPVDPPDRPTWIDGVDNPYLHGPYTPVVSEITAVDLEVLEGEIPDDLYGAYLRNGPNPVLKPRGLYHWFDGDGMVARSTSRASATAGTPSTPTTARTRPTPR